MQHKPANCNTGPFKQNIVSHFKKLRASQPTVRMTCTHHFCSLELLCNASGPNKQQLQFTKEGGWGCFLTATLTELFLCESSDTLTDTNTFRRKSCTFPFRICVSDEMSVLGANRKTLIGKNIYFVKPNERQDRPSLRTSRGSLLQKPDGTAQ